MFQSLILSLTLLLMCLFQTQCAANLNIKKGFSSNKIIKEMSQGKNVFYQDKTFENELDFTSVKNAYCDSENSLRHDINSSITFKNCTFKANVIAFLQDEQKMRHFVTFQKNLTFLNCRFEGEVNFRNAKVNGLVNFSGCEFDKKTSFENIFCGDMAMFQKCIFYDELRFQNAIFSHNCNFMDTQFEGLSSFQQAVFRQDAQFGVTKFLKYADFSSIIAKSHLFFNYAEFTKQAIFNNAAFYGRAEFMNCQFKHYAEFKRSAFYGQTRFVKSNFDNVFLLDESRFLLDKPDLQKIVLADKENLSVKETQYFRTESLLKNDFLEEK